MKRAYHRMQISAQETIEGPLVVETDGEGRFLSWHLLLEEEPCTEWLGGTYSIENQSLKQTHIWKRSLSQ